MLIRKLTVAAAAVGALVLVGPVASASADIPAAATVSDTPPPVLTFVPPSVGPICVNIGPIIIGGQIMSPGIHMCLQSPSLPAFSYSPAS